MIPSSGRPPPQSGPRHSAATLRHARSGGNRLSVIVAFSANVVVALAKLAAGLFTGSSALLSEALHSAADSINQVLLGVSLRKAQRPPDAEHPFGHSGERFLWAFLAAIGSFLIGGCFSIALAIRQLTQGGEVDHFLVAWIVLGVAALADGLSLAQGLRQTRREAAQWSLPPATWLRVTSDPIPRAIVVEDGAALLGDALAATGILVHQLGGPPSSDGIASLLIGILLAATAVALARPLADLLIGKSIAPPRVAKARAILASSPGIDEVLSLYAVYAGPQEAMVAAKVHPAPGQSADQIAHLLDELDRRLRRELPEVGEVFIDLTAHQLPGDDLHRAP